MELCECPTCGLPAEVEVHPTHDERPGDTVRLLCVARHWFLGPRRLLVPAQRRPQWDPVGPSRAGSEGTSG